VRLSTTLNLLGLHRRRREALRTVQEHVEALQNIVGLLASIAEDTYPYDEPAELRAGCTVMLAAAREIASRSIDLASTLGEVRFTAHLQALEIEPSDQP